MRLLLDTHIALWAITDDDRLSAHARALIEDPDNEVSVSAATLWEIAIKHGLRRDGPNGMPVSADEALGYFRAAGYVLLDITPAHAVAVGGLPAYHADPFDRLLVAQAMTIPLRLVTGDAKVARYGGMVLAV